MGSKQGSKLSSRTQSAAYLDEVAQSMRMQIQLHAVSLFVRASTDSGIGQLVEPVAISVVLHTSQSAREVTQALTVRVSHVAAQLNVHTHVPALLDAAAPWRAAALLAASSSSSPVHAPAPPLAPTASTGASKAALTSIDVSCDGVSVRAVCGAAHGLLSLHELQLSSLVGPMAGDKRESFTLRMFEVDYQSAAVGPLIHARMHALAGNSEAIGCTGITEGGMRLNSLRVAIVNGGSAAEAFVFTCPADGDEAAVALSASRAAEIDDVALSVSQWHASLSNLDACAALARAIAAEAERVDQLILTALPPPPPEPEVQVAEAAAEKAPKEGSGSALALRCDFLGAHAVASLGPHTVHATAAQLGSACVRVLRDRSGGQTIDVSLEGVGITSTLDGHSASCHLLHPCHITLGVALPRAAMGSMGVTFEVDAIRVSLPDAHREALHHDLTCIQVALAPSPAAHSAAHSAAPRPAAEPPPSLGDLSVHFLSVAIDVGPFLLSGSDISVRFRTVGEHVSLSLLWECLAFHDTLRARELCRAESAAGEGHERRRVKFLLEMRPTGMYVDLGCPQFSLLVRASLAHILPLFHLV